LIKCLSAIENTGQAIINNGEFPGSMADFFIGIWYERRLHHSARLRRYCLAGKPSNKSGSIASQMYSILKRRMTDKQLQKSKAILDAVPEL
jgi:hypothetical protein